MTTTITTSVTLVRGDVILIDDEPMRVTESLGDGTYAVTTLTRWERWRMRART